MCYCWLDFITFETPEVVILGIFALLKYGNDLELDIGFNSVIFCLNLYPKFVWFATISKSLPIKVTHKWQ